MGLGKIAMTVDSLSSSPSSSTALCCSILTARGTSSSLVQPPRGCSSRTGRLYPLDSNCRLWKVSLIKENTSSIVKSFSFHCIFDFLDGSISPAVGHEKSMSIMNRIPQLESKDCIRSQFLELFPQLWIERGLKGKAWSSCFLPGGAWVWTRQDHLARWLCQAPPGPRQQARTQMPWSSE